MLYSVCVTNKEHNITTVAGLFLVVSCSVWNNKNINERCNNEKHLGSLDYKELAVKINHCRLEFSVLSDS